MLFNRRWWSFLVFLAGFYVFIGTFVCFGCCLNFASYFSVLVKMNMILFIVSVLIRGSKSQHIGLTLTVLLALTLLHIHLSLHFRTFIILHFLFFHTIALMTPNRRMLSTALVHKRDEVIVSIIYLARISIMVVSRLNFLHLMGI